MNPAEHLRAITRRGVDEEQIASEAASALAGFASDPASLVVACRRVLAHHPASAPLWWLAARILAAPDPVAECRASARFLDADRTADRLAASLPILDDGDVVAIVGWPSAVDRALAERADIEAVVVRTAGDDSVRRVRRRQGERRVRVLDIWDLSGLAVTHVLVPARAIGPDRVIVAAGTSQIIEEVETARAHAEMWLLGGVGRVLPARLFGAAVVASGAAPADSLPAIDEPSEALHDDDGPVELVVLEAFDRLAGPRGPERPAEAAARFDCPIVPELLRPL